MSARSTAGSLTIWLGLAAIVVLADQVTKTLILGAFADGEARPVTSFFNLVRVHNPGAAFSFLAGASGWQRWFFAGLGLAASAFIVLRRSTIRPYCGSFPACSATISFTRFGSPSSRLTITISRFVSPSFGLRASVRM